MKLFGEGILRQLFSSIRCTYLLAYSSAFRSIRSSNSLSNSFWDLTLFVAFNWNPEVANITCQILCPGRPQYPFSFGLNIVLLTTLLPCSFFPAQGHQGLCCPIWAVWANTDSSYQPSFPYALKTRLSHLDQRRCFQTFAKCISLVSIDRLKI